MTMDSKEYLTPLPEHGSSRPAFEELSNLPHLDETDELLLLRMAEISDDPVSPRLEAIMDKDHEPHDTELSKLSTAQVVMERPKSSGINLDSFSFTKPVRYGGRLNRKMHKNTTPIQNLHENKTVSGAEQDMGRLKYG